MATTIYMLYYVVQKTSFEITFSFYYGLMYGIKEATQPYMSYVWFPRNIYGGHPGVQFIRCAFFASFNLFAVVFCSLKKVLAARLHDRNNST